MSKDVNIEIKKPDGLIKAGVIIAFIVYAFWSLTIIGLLWTIPGFISGSRLLQGNKNSQVVSGVIGLIFAGVIPGIFILVGKFE